MISPNWKPVNLPMKDGFKLVLSFEPEHICAKEHFINDCEWSESDYEGIKNYYMFIAVVTAYKGTIKAGDDALAGCCHSSKKDVIDSEIGGYLPQMIDKAIGEAKENLEMD